MVSANDLMLFHAVAEAGGFSAASRALGVTRQAVSERVARIEEDLGVRLFERTTRTTRLTEAGYVYARRCAAIAAAIREATAEVQGLAREPTGLLRVSAPVLFGRRHLAPVAADLRRSYPHLRIDVQLADRFVDLVAEGIDVAIRVGAPGDSSLVARRIGQGIVQLVASPAWLDRHGPVTVESLEREICIVQVPGERWTVEGREVQVGEAMIVNDIETGYEAAIAGVGVARLPSFVHAQAVADGRLVPLFDGAATMTPPIYAVFPSREYLPAKVRVFVDAVATAVGREFPDRAR